MAFFTRSATYKRTIKDPDTGDEATITLRPLNAGDRAELQDLTRMQMGDEGSAELRLGQMQLITVSRAIVDWTLDEPTTPEAVAMLHPDVFDDIYSHISWGSVPTEEPADASPLDGTEGEPAETLERPAVLAS